MNALLKSAAALWLTTCLAAAAIPRTTELEMQSKSPEQLEIEVVKRKKMFRGTTFKIVATAKVTKVTKTASELKVGSELKIEYSVPSTPIPGAPPSVVEKGKKYAAFLKKVGEHYQPAAASGSFEVVAAKSP